MENIVNDFIRKYQGKRVTGPQGLGGECVDLVTTFMTENGYPRIWGDGSDWQYRAQPDIPFRSVDENRQPRPGDIMVWGTAIAGGYGHIAIFVSGTKKDFRSFDQNWPRGSSARVMRHNSRGVVGWLDLNYRRKSKGDESRERRFVVFQKGDTVWKYSQKYGIPVDTLLKLNKIDDPTTLPIGYKLYLE